jgi:hypothetical protein
MLRLHSYILWSLLKFFHIKSQHYILCMIYIYKGGGTHTVVCTAHLYSAKHTVVFIWSSWVVKITQPLFYFYYFFNIKFIIFFSKTFLTKSVRNVEIAFLYIMKHVKILSYKVTTLHFMYDIYIYIYICNFFFKNIFNKKCQKCWDCIPIYYEAC